MRKILVIDDNDLDRMFVATMFRKIAPDAEVVEVENPREAADTYRKIQPALTLLDINMPGYSGFRVLEAIKGRSISCPVVMFTSSSSSLDRQQALMLGASDYKVKPSSLEGYMEVARSLSRVYLDASFRTISVAGFLRPWRRLRWPRFRSAPVPARPCLP